MIEYTLIFIKSLLFKIINCHIYTLTTLGNSVILFKEIMKYIPYILIEEHLKRCNLNFVLIKRGPNA